MSLVALYPFSRDGRIRHTSSYRTQEILLAFFSKRVLKSAYQPTVEYEQADVSTAN
ncbi:hypothetical protein T4A_2981 [Trichinella pseudospiralis]|uniref:Uncharacterized protein n=1 Tax=Trichinella pseudospiralis TaxID=6337 RepID=A0A0V1DTB0_TRIPS|nr:hypothetical protein T4A_2981 [Trichinella pseudospiralis]